MRLLPRFALVIVASGLVLALAVGAMAVPAGLLGDAGSGEPAALALGPLAQRSYVYAADGSVLAVLKDEENRQPVRLDSIPKHVVNAIVAVEDSGFWVHDGFDVRGMMRAFRANVDSGGISQGGSTITQQLVKLEVLGSKQTLDRKVQEIVLASRLEKSMTKEQILSRYLNTVYFGNHAYGVQSAAETYFGVGVKELDVAQAALLAGIIRNPIAYNPIRFPEKALERRQVALDRMVAVGDLTEDEAALWSATPMPKALHEVLPKANDYFASAVEEQLLADERLGKTETERRRAVYQGGLRIYTTYDRNAQAMAQQARDQNLPLTNGVFAAGTDPATGKPRFGSAAVISVVPQTGAVPYMVAGPGFKNYRYNLATQNKRQTGSSFKTFVLTTLMEQGKSPNNSVNGSGPCKFDNRGGEPNPYEVENFDASRGGVDTILGQTLRSSNCAYVRLGLIAGLGNVVNMAQRLGVTSTAKEDGLTENKSLPLGTARVSPLDMASAYATLANDGVYNAPYTIEKVLDHRGKMIFQHKPAPKRVLSSQTARLVTSILEQNVQSGTGTAARIRTGQPTAGKTGTHTGSYDAWFVGYSRQLATAVWIGGLGAQFSITLGGSGITGGSYPARIWGDFMTAWHTNRPIEDFPDPASVPGGGLLEVPGGQDLSPAPTSTTVLPPAPPPPPPAQGQPAPAPRRPPGTTAPPQPA
jgi:penicillin-binding protein 1A